MANISNYGLVGVGSSLRFSKGGANLSTTGSSFTFLQSDNSTDAALTAGAITSSAGNVTLTTGNVVLSDSGGILSIGGDTTLSRLEAGVFQFNGTQAVVVPDGTTVQRPGAVAGGFRYNSTTGYMEYSNGTAWFSLASGTSSVASFSAGTTGFSPSTPTTGIVTLSGILNPASGGTGVNNGTYTTTLGGNISTGGTLSTTGTFSTGGNFSTGGTFSTSNNFATTGGNVTLNTAAGSSVTLPASGTVLTTSDTSNYVSSFQTSLSGLTPSSATNGAVTLAGTLGATSGGTGSSSAPTSGQFLYSSGGTTYAPTTLSSVAVVSVLGTTNEISASTVSGVTTLSIPSTFIAPGSLEVTTTSKFDGLMYESAAAVAAAGSSAGTATVLTKQYNVVTSGTGGVMLPEAAAGLEITLVNFTNADILVYGQTGPEQDYIDAAAVSVTLPAHATASYQCVNSDQWYTVNPALTVSGAGLGISFGNGITTLTNTGVTSFSTSLSGLTPSSSATGSITLAGTLGVASGGTGATTLTNHGVLLGSGTSAVTVTSPGTQYQVLNSSGSGADPVFDAVHLDQSAAVTGNLPLSNGGTNASLTAVAGAPVYSTGSALAIGTAGTSGQAYISGGTSAPTWQTVASTLTTNQILEGNGSGAFTANGGTFVGSGTFSGVTLQGTVYNATDAATKAYVDAAVSGLNIHTPAETASLPTDSTLLGTATYTPGVAGGSPDTGAGVGAYLTFPAAASLSIGGYSLTTIGQRVLIKDYTSGSTPTYIANGIYVVSQIGSLPSTTWKLTRSSDYDNSIYGEVKAGDFIFVQEGTNANTGWVETSVGTQSPGDCIKIGTNPIVFSQFSGAGTYTPGLGLYFTGGTTFNVGVDGTTTYIDGSIKVAVKSSATANQVLLSNGSSTTPSWGALTLGNASSVTGTLPVGNGGTGSTSFTTNGIVYGGSTLSSTAAGTNGQVLVGNTGSAPSWSTLSGIAVTSLTGTANQIDVSASTGSVTLSLDSVLIAPGSLEVTTTSKFDGLMYESTGAVTALVGGQGAAPLTKQFNIVTSTGTGQGVTLPTAAAGLEIEIANIGGNAINVYPATGASIDGAAVNVAISVPAGATWTGEASSATQWYSVDPATVSGTGISVTYLPGQTVVANTGVLSFDGGTTGLTPTGATTGGITLGGTLVVANGGTGATSLTTNGMLYGNGTSAISATSAGSQYQVFQAGSGGVPTVGAVHLDQSAAITGILPTTNGGTGLSSFTANEVFYAGSSSVVAQSPAFTFDGTSKLAVGTATGQITIDGSTATGPAISATGTSVNITLNPGAAGAVLVSPLSGEGTISSESGHSLTVQGDLGLTLGVLSSSHNLVLSLPTTSSYAVISGPSASAYAGQLSELSTPNAIPNVQYVTNAIAASIATGGVQTVQATVSLASAGTTNIGLPLPANSGMQVLSVRVNVTSVDTGTSTLSVGVAGNTAAFMATTENDPQIAGIYVAEDYAAVASGAQIIATVTGVPVSGSCTVIVEYAA